jgi:hypothetical protein
MILSNSQIKILEDKINSCVCWAQVASNTLAQLEARQRAMKWHDEDAQIVNDILGVNAFHLFIPNVDSEK